MLDRCLLHAFAQRDEQGHSNRLVVQCFSGMLDVDVAADVHVNVLAPTVLLAVRQPELSRCPIRWPVLDILDACHFAVSVDMDFLCPEAVAGGEVVQRALDAAVSNLFRDRERSSHMRVIVTPPVERGQRDAELLRDLKIVHTGQRAIADATQDVDAFLALQIAVAVSLVAGSAIARRVDVRHVFGLGPVRAAPSRLL